MILNKSKAQVLAAMAVLIAILPTTTTAGPIIAPVTAASQCGGNTTNLINQSGLNPTYQSGTTLFDTYVASATHVNGVGSANWFVSGSPPCTLTFDLGSETPIDKIALWNLVSTSSIRGFSLYSDDDSIPQGGASQLLLGSFTAQNGTGASVSAQVFSFAPTTTRWVHLVVTSNGGGGFINLGELAFRAAQADPEDRDGDGLPNEVETNTGTWVGPEDTGTDPDNPDTDGDGLRDGVETCTGIFISAEDTGTDPNDPADFPLPGRIIAPVSMTSGCGGNLTHAIDQSGLSRPYEHGFTDFDSYVASATHINGVGSANWFTSANPPCTLTFDLGLETPIDRIVLWNVQSTSAIGDFSLYSDSDSNPQGGAPAQLLGSFTAQSGIGPNCAAQVFSIPTTTTRWVHLEITSRTGLGSFLNLGEAAFRAAEDRDGDGLPNNVETNTGTWVSKADTGTDPDNPDTDGDGLADGVETCTGIFVSTSDTGTDPNLDDSDGDGLSDTDEVNVHMTNPNDPDTDVDSVPDGKEVDAGSDPLLNDDTDGDGIDNLEESEGTLNPWVAGVDTASTPGEATDPCDPDTDMDGVNDGDEMLIWTTDPNRADSDDDGLSDSEEVLTHLTNPTNEDSDGDGLLDGDEVKGHNTDPLEPDSDDDGSSDGEEVAAGTSPLDATDWFRILDIAHEAGQTTIRWSSVPGKRYRVKVGTDLIAFGNVAGAEEIHAAAAPAKETMFTDSVDRGADAYYVVAVLDD